VIENEPFSMFFQCYVPQLIQSIFFNFLYFCEKNEKSKFSKYISNAKKKLHSKLLRKLFKSKDVSY
jgi:hypothetical protein